MNRFLAALAVACLALIALAGLAAAQTQSTGSAVFEVFRPFLVEVASVFVSAVVLWLAATMKAKLNIDIEAKHREALQAALTNAAGLVINRAGGMAGAIALPGRSALIVEGVDYVVQSAPDALKHFGITPEAAGEVLKQKLEAKIGVMVSTGAAAQA
jgi:cytochrome bd-type quinol oxidase subunit 2